MIDVLEEKPAGLLKAEEKLQRAANRLKAEKKKAGEEKRKQDTHNKIVMGGIVKKFFPECIYFEQDELEWYDVLKDRYDQLAGADTTFRPKKWREEIAELERTVEEYQRSALGSAVSVTTAEVYCTTRGIWKGR